MTPTRKSLFASLVALGTSLAATAGCSSSNVGNPVADSGSGATDGAACTSATCADAGAGADGGSSPLRWYTTCGNSVCQGPGDGGSVDAGACAAVGTSCAVKGDTCGTSDPQVNCGTIEVCDDHDPKSLGCPVSTRTLKDGIEYLDRAQLEQLHDETLRMRLATYSYKSQVADPSAKHLGFIVEDAPRSLAVDRGHDRVDMYGYLSMIVATAQVQEREIARLREELEAMRAAPRCSSSPTIMPARR